jgi:exopolysaccharide biosynthesis polyprenyl glycosylphosphotransferase
MSNGAGVISIGRESAASVIDLRDRVGDRVHRDERRARSTKKANHLRTRLVTLDVLALVAAWAPAAVIGGADGWLGVLTVAAAVMGGLLVLAAAGLYRSRVSSVRARELSRLVWVGAIVPVFPWELWRVADHPVSWLALVAGGFLSFLLLVITRSGFDAWLRGRRAAGYYCRGIVIVGTNPEAIELQKLLLDHRELGYRVAGFVGPEPDGSLPNDAAYLGDVDELTSALESTGAGGVMVAAGALGRSERPIVRELLSDGYHVHCSGGFWGIDHRRVTPLPIGHEPLFYIEPLSLARHQMVIKRTLDIVLSSLVLLLMAPVMIVCALIIKLFDGGPVLFRQQRIGGNGVPFTFYKLRSMVPEADQIRNQFDGLNLRDGPLFKAKDDPRVTPFGRVLRMSSLDELPQLFNVLKGDMSLVGPRPALASEFEQFDDELLARQQVRPGISGLWQVEARDNPSFAAYKRLDLFYVENWSVSLDLVILVLTAQQVTARVVRGLWAKVKRNPAVVGD